MPLAFDWPTFFTATSAIAAAVAAIAAWATVFVEHRARARAREPLLSISVSGMFVDQGTRDRIVVENEGGGVARAVTFLVVSGRDACMGGLPPTGTLAPGGRVVLDPAYAATTERTPITAAVICRFGRYFMAWDAAGRHERHRLTGRSGVSHEDMFRRFYPDAPSVEELTPYRHVEVCSVPIPGDYI